MKITELVLNNYGAHSVWLLYFEITKPIQGQYPNIVLNTQQALTLLRESRHIAIYISPTLVKYTFIN
jgi:hypothetical protein